MDGEPVFPRPSTTRVAGHWAERARFSAAFECNPQEMGEVDQLIAGRYRLAEQLGRGGMGDVWQAYDERLHRKVAVKQLFVPAHLDGERTDQVVRQTVREGQIAARLQHKNVVSVFDVIEHDGTAYLIMEYLRSHSLSQVLQDQGTLPPDAVRRIGTQLADALDAAHAAGIVHRDVKPSNILLGYDGTAKITDFGISRAVEDATTGSSGTVLGTPAYMPPEVAKGERATFASDVYSLGASLYMATEGTPPVGQSGNTIALLYRAASGEITPPSNSGPLTEVLQRMLHTDPAMRPTMSEVRDALAALPVLTEQPTTELKPVTPQEKPKEQDKPPRRRRLAALIAAAVLLVAGGVLAFLMIPSNQTEQTAAPPSSSSATASPPAAPSTGSTGAAPATPPPAGQPPAASQPPPVDALTATPDVITAYYALMPGNLDQAWTRLTPKYQQHPAGGRSGYQRFWNRIARVQVSGVSPVAGNNFEATVEYHFKDGKVMRERHRYTVVRQNGSWKIDESAVLSSRTL
ncbi:Serine/threonine-protein kinase pksC [Kibdelosporangium sp. 4NS15]|uniref:non-specific serine/threonine protein kinase n=1 Tax=Kibdelosporangium persicum TaxID=2698649 RepID=A0ABX2F885_9PSEU|nr:Serine/threonine-protein kinase pksC [Kibdelosporangium persicum]